MDFNNIISEFMENEFLKKDNKKVKEETLEEYLGSFTKDKLISMYLVRMFVYADVQNIKKYTNKKIIQLINDNLYEVLDAILSVIRYEFIEQLKIVINSTIDKKYYIKNYKFNYSFIYFLKRFSLAKIEYNSDEGYVKFFMPDEFRVIFNKLLSNKDIVSDVKLSSDLYSFIESVLGTYGIIEINKLYEIVVKRFRKINKNEFEFVLFTKRLVEEFYTYDYLDTKIICHLDFDTEEEAIEFYNNQTMDYKIYNKNEYELISNGNYVEKLNAYKKFIKYLLNNYENIKEDLEEIKDILIIDYIYSSRKSIDEANNNFRKNILNFFEEDGFVVEYMLNMLKKIYEEYPKWSKRGNI